MITLAIDASTKSTGVAIYSDQELVHYNCITAGSANLYKRIDKMIEGLEEIIGKYNPDAVVIEDVIPEDVHNNDNVFKALIYLQGFIMHLLNDHKITDITFFTASQWRKKCGIRTGRGVRRSSLKPQDVAFVKTQFNIEVNDDIADAVCIGFAKVGGTIKQPQIIVDDTGFEFA